MIRLINFNTFYVPDAMQWAIGNAELFRGSTGIS